MLTVLVDTSEKNPWAFSPGVLLAYANLASGDYTVEGLERVITLERKSLDDLANTLAHDRDRFFAEARRLQEYRYRAIIVEGDLRQILDGSFRSRMTPESLIGTCATFAIDYEIPVFFCSTRAAAALYAEKLLTRASRRWIVRRSRARRALTAPTPAAPTPRKKRATRARGKGAT